MALLPSPRAEPGAEAVVGLQVELEAVWVEQEQAEPQAVEQVVLGLVWKAVAAELEPAASGPAPQAALVRVEAEWAEPQPLERVPLGLAAQEVLQRALPLQV